MESGQQQRYSHPYFSIAYGIVTTHRGTISVRSEMGKGSTFTIRMPIAEEGGLV